MGERIFLSIGTNNLEGFSILSNKWFLIRTIEEPIRPIPLTKHNIVLARGPFNEAQEQTLLTKFHIDVLVSKNSGGALAAKLYAAHKLGIPIIVIEQPSLPVGKVTHTIEKTLEWLIEKI
jgi:precorrin-6A/cobalt-precorrin-6A reductase